MRGVGQMERFSWNIDASSGVARIGGEGAMFYEAHPSSCAVKRSATPYGRHQYYIPTKGARKGGKKTISCPALDIPLGGPGADVARGGSVFVTLQILAHFFVLSSITLFSPEGCTHPALLSIRFPLQYKFQRIAHCHYFPHIEELCHNHSIGLLHFF